MTIGSRLAGSAKNAGKIALIIFSCSLSAFLFRWGIYWLFGDKSSLDWALAIKICVASGAIWFTVFFTWNLVSLTLRKPLLDILDEETPESNLEKTPLSGFVAMEYFWLILNRTYVVFIAREGLYGWRAEGPRASSDPSYFEPYQEMVDDKDFMRDRRAIEKFSRLAGGFFLDRSTISSIQVIDRQKWGMGGIPHTGRIRVNLNTGKSREFILLGSVNPDGIRDKIATALRVGVLAGV
jgi:hypothetical protein